MFDQPPVKRARTTKTAVGSGRMTAAGNYDRRVKAPGPRTSGSLTQQVKALQRAVKKVLPEMKYADAVLDTSNITTSGTVIHLTAVPEDDTATGRTGNVIYVKSLSINGYFLRSTDITYTMNAMYRIMVVIDKQQVSDTAPAISDVLDYGASNSTRIFPKVAALERFRVLWISEVYEGHRMNISDAGGGLNGINPASQSTIFNYHNDNVNLRVDFNGAASTDIQKNGIYLLILSNDTANVIDINGVSRIGFHDA